MAVPGNLRQGAEVILTMFKCSVIEAETSILFLRRTQVMILNLSYKRQPTGPSKPSARRGLVSVYTRNDFVDLLTYVHDDLVSSKAFSPQAYW